MVFVLTRAGKKGITIGKMKKEGRKQKVKSRKERKKGKSFSKFLSFLLPNDESGIPKPSN